ncbi:MAG: PKD domain-containing protein, partial [Candidatus Cloacimonadota bacterium]|nr:PKD domain-containing protein [Candidatus Cloacimonadota bacterium]
MHLTNFKFQKILFALISILFSTSSYFATDITETIQFGGAGEDGASIIKTDIYDNIYVAGSFYSSISFGEFELTSNGVNDAFLLKMNSDNAVLWAISFGSPEDENIYDFDFDSDNNIFVTGIYSGTINFDTQTLTPTADSEAFVAKFNDSGEFVWAASSQGNIGEENKSYAVSLDYSENVIICGEYTGTITFGESTVTALDDNDIFVAKLNNDGDWLWGQTGGSNSSYDAGEDVVCDSDDNIYVTGHFREDATFGDIQVPEIGTVCIFLAKLTPEGNWEWVSPAGGSSIDMGFGVAIDSENEIFVTGMFKDDANFGEHSIVGNGEYEAFIANNIDGEWQWVVNGGSPNHEISFGIDLDNDENILISGRFRETAIFGEYQVTSNGDEDAFCAKLNSNSQEWEWVVAGGGIDQDNSLSVSSNSLNEIYFCGFFNTTATFGNTEIISNGSSDIFICKASEPVQLEANFTFSDSIGYYPLSVEFLDLSIGNPTAWSWDFQNDGIIDSNEQNPSFIYTEAGEFSVKLVTSNETEESEQIQENVIHIYENNISENLAITPDSLIFLDMDSCFNGIEITIENLIPLEMEFQNLEF